MTVEIVTYDKSYPIRITDGWDGKVCLTLNDAKELTKDLKKIIKELEKTP